MVQEEGAEDDIDAALGEWQRERIADDPRRPGHGGVHGIEIERGDHSSRKAAANYVPHVAGAAADVENAEAVTGRGDFADQPPRDPMSARELIDAGEVAQALARVVLGRRVKELRLDDPLRQTAHSAMVTGGG